MKHLALALVAALAAIVATGCGVNDYCLNCALDAGDGDGGDGDGGSDGTVAQPDACIPAGTETCNGLDDDCDMRVDEEVPTVGDACGTDEGECTAGVWQCTAGTLACSGVGGSPEICDNLDNNCNGTADEGNPGGGVPCGSDVGECVAGITMCVGGAIDCVGDIGTPGAVPETCDGRDNDCDNNFDEGLPPLGSCGMTGVGECELGTLMCVGGAPVCIGEVGPTLELCDTLDQDCDGNPTNGFNLNTDPRNCGMCNRVCNLPHANEGCAGGNCAVASCDPDFYNVNGMAADGCEYACTFRGAQEACNQQDDNCNGMVDEGLTPPPICLTQGACAGTVATCTASGWDCVYGANVTTDAAGDVVPENRCDNIDNDCDGRVDEGHPLKGQACGDSGVGVCQGRGTYVCGATPTAAVTCNVTTPGGTASAELCDNLDNNCNGIVDDNPAQDWVSIGGGRQVMKWEASHPDATATNAGAVTTKVCSRTGVLPWTSVTYGQARAACQTLGAGVDLCTEQDWHRACSVVTKSTYPLAAPGAAPAYLFIEAEDYLSVTSATSTGTGAGLHAWVPDSAPSDYSGISALRASPNLGADVSVANAPTQSPRLDYQIAFPATAAATNYYVWVRMYSAAGADDTIRVGMNTALPGTPTVQLVTPSNGAWVWVQSSAFSIPAAGGNRYLNIWMREDGIKVDAIVITRSSSTTAPTEVRTHGGTWSYATNNTTYQLGVCNEDNYDTNTGLAGDQDDLLVGGNRASCYANWTASDRIHDLSGNAKEWTMARMPGINPLRGGASNNEGTGITCDLAFTSANDTFFFPNVGFRCCR